jgi:hypothetical protein
VTPLEVALASVACFAFVLGADEWARREFYRRVERERAAEFERELARHGVELVSFGPQQAPANDVTSRGQQARRRVA